MKLSNRQVLQAVIDKDMSRLPAKIRGILTTYWDDAAKAYNIKLDDKTIGYISKQGKIIAKRLRNDEKRGLSA